MAAPRWCAAVSRGYRPNRAQRRLCLANNIGLREVGFGDGVAAPPRYALLLNPDTWSRPMDAHGGLYGRQPRRGVVGQAGAAGWRFDAPVAVAFPPEVSFYRLTGLSRLFPRSRVLGATT